MALRYKGAQCSQGAGKGLAWVQQGKRAVGMRLAWSGIRWSPEGSCKVLGVHSDLEILCGPSVSLPESAGVGDREEGGGAAPASWVAPVERLGGTQK